jgi:hypothetical protein
MIALVFVDGIFHHANECFARIEGGGGEKKIGK